MSLCSEGVGVATMDIVKGPEMKSESSTLIMSMQPISFKTLLTAPSSGTTVDDTFLDSTPGNARKKDERFPHWGYHETRELISTRAELEKNFTQTKRNKTLWETIAGRMKEKGFERSADQCKYKWKNLVNRYKGKEVSEPDNGRQCPFFEELDAVFKERANNIDGLLLDSELGGRAKKKLKNDMLGEKLSDDDSEEDDEEEESEDELLVRRKRRKELKERQRIAAERCRANSLQEALEYFFQQQFRVEEQWQETYKKRDLERRTREREWRASMEKLEQERITIEQAYREREEQRRSREEDRSNKRDELFAVLVTRFLQKDS